MAFPPGGSGETRSTPCAALRGCVYLGLFVHSHPRKVPIQLRDCIWLLETCGAVHRLEYLGIVGYFRPKVVLSGVVFDVPHLVEFVEGLPEKPPADDSQGVLPCFLVEG